MWRFDSSQAHHICKNLAETCIGNRPGDGRNLGESMPIDYYGFLGKDIEQFKKEVFVKHKEVFAFFEEFNHFLQEMKFNLRVKDFDAWRITIVALFIKSLETFQSIYVLVTHCLSIDAENLTRVLFEAMVKIGYCSKGKSEFKRYTATHLHNIKKIINAAENNQSEFPKELFERKPLNLIKKEIDDMLDTEGNPKEITIESMAREIEIIKLYNSYYRSVCTSVHSAPKSLEKYVITGKNGEIEKFTWGPRMEGIIMHLFTAIEFMLLICKFLSGLFGVPMERDISDFNMRKDKLVKKYPVESQEQSSTL